MATISQYQELNPLGGKIGEDRLIGLEIETTRDRATRPNEVSQDAWTISDFCEDEDYDYDYDNEEERYITEISRELREFMGEEIVAMIGSDGADIEIATQPMSKNYLNNNTKFQEFLYKLKKYYIPEKESGTHIHISELIDDNENIKKNLHWFALTFDKQLYKIFRRKSHWALSPRDLFAERYYSNNPNGKKYICYDSVAVKGLRGEGIKGTLIAFRENTYECRGGSASTDPEEIKAWANMFYSIVETCNQDSIIGLRFEDFIGDAPFLITSRITGEELRQICPQKVYL